MNSPGDLTVTHSSATPDPKNCSLVSIIPIVGMSSCRGRAEAFARRLSSKLRTLGTQADDAEISQEDEPIINGGNTNTWITGSNGGGEQQVTALQPLRHETDSFFDFDCEIESPGSPVDECEYLRLIESSSNTPHNSAAESGYACASAASSQSSSDGPYFDVNSENEASCTSHSIQLPPKRQHQQIPTPTNHICQSHVTTSNDEVDSSASIKPAASAQSNGYHSPKDLIETLPSDGPDIETTTKNLKETNHLENPKQIAMTQTIQEKILKELHKQSNEHTGVEQDYNTKTNLNETTHESPIPQIVHITNGHAENGEDVIKLEIIEETKDIVKTETRNETETETAIENETKKATDSNDNEIKSINESCKAETTTEKPKTSHLHMETTDDEDDCRPQRVRRCSSLKTGKTPPGTPGRKKIVRFADVLGLDLADVKTFLDEIPNIPKSAYEDLEILESEPPMQLGPKSDKLLMPLFQQPGGLPNFLDTVREKLVSLENAAVTDAINQTITGSVRVRNLDFHKSVHIRYSLDGWRSFADLQANYVENSCDGFSDKFTFILFGNSLHIGQRLEFAVRFQCKGHQYWDNNYGANYSFQCLPTAASSILNPITTILPSHHSNNMVSLLSPTVGETWCASFY